MSFGYLFRTISLGLTLMVVGPAMGQETPKPVESAKAAPTDTYVKTPTSFDRTERMENMRYQHLWLAYSFIWLIIFGLVYRTWKLNQGTLDELKSLQRRIAALEDTDGSD